jgi:hypothetical protein
MTLPELESGLGRPDLVVIYQGRIYVIEMKIAQGEANTVKAAVLGMEQIRERGYGEAYDNPIAISLAVDTKKRNIGACIFEKDGVVLAVKLD